MMRYMWKETHSGKKIDVYCLYVGKNNTLRLLVVLSGVWSQETSRHIEKKLIF